jgi:hypothetical protein
MRFIVVLKKLRHKYSQITSPAPEAVNAQQYHPDMANILRLEPVARLPVASFRGASQPHPIQSKRSWSLALAVMLGNADG